MRGVTDWKWWQYLLVVLMAVGMALATYQFHVWDFAAIEIGERVVGFIQVWIGMAAWFMKWVLTPLMIVMGFLYCVLMLASLAEKGKPSKDCPKEP